MQEGAVDVCGGCSRTGGLPVRVAATWRALALTACTLWSNMLLTVAPLHDAAGDAELVARTASMFTSLLGFALVFAVARRAGRVGRSRALQTCGALCAVAGSAAHLFGAGSVPMGFDVLAVAVYSVGFAFLLVGCGEVYAGISSREALIYASVSYFLAWTGSSVVGSLPPVAACTIASAMPLVVLAMMPCWSRAAGGAASRSVGRASSLADDVRLTCAALSPKMMLALAITYFAMGTAMAGAGGPETYFSLVGVAFAALTSLVCLGLGIALHGHVPLITFYKVLLILQVMAAFLLSELAGPAQLVSVVAMVGVCIVSWTLLAQCARSGSVGPGCSTVACALPAFVYAAGHFCQHLGEGLGTVLALGGALSPGVGSNVVVVLLVVVAAFLFTGNPEGVGSLARRGARPDSGVAGGDVPPTGPAGTDEAAGLEESAARDLPSGRPAPTDERIAELAGRYRLSQRETEVFALWATGHDIKYIQDKLGLSQSTVKTHVRHIYAKTDLHSRADVVMLLDGDE